MSRDHAVSAGSAPVSTPGREGPSVWFRPTANMGPDDVAEARLLLSAAENARADRFVFERDRRDYVAAHALLRLALRQVGGEAADHWRIEAGEAGKPFLADRPKLHFNITHTDGLVACVLSSAGPVGIDAERIDRPSDAEAIAERYFARREVAALKVCAESGARQARFTEIWTLKEAYVKGLGVGLGNRLDAFWFSFPDERRLDFGAEADAEGWRFGLFAPIEGYRLAVAAHGVGGGDLRARSWPMDGRYPPLEPLRSG